MDPGTGTATPSAEATLLLELARFVTGSTHLQDVLDKSLAALRRLADFHGGSIQLIRDGALQMVASYPPAPPEAYAFRLPIGHGFGGWVAATGLPIYSPDATLDPRANPAGRRSASSPGVRTYFAAPLIMNGAPIGIVQIDSFEVDAFSEATQARLLSFVPTIAAAVQSAERDTGTKSIDLRDESPASDVAALVSCELRAPVSSLREIARTIRDRAAPIDGADAAALAERILTETLRLEDLIADLAGSTGISARRTRPFRGPSR